MDLKQLIAWLKIWKINPEKTPTIQDEAWANQFESKAEAFWYGQQQTKNEILEELEHYENYPTYYDTIVSSPAWQAWEKVAHERGFDWHESVECGWLSQKHFAAFLKWYKHECSDLKSE